MKPTKDAYRLYSNTDDVGIYRTTNENLEKLFSNIPIYNKDVLSVMASGDQPIYSYMLGAKKVDAFDKEPYALYHFYLRKWLMEYEDIRIVTFDSKFSYKKLLDKVVPKTYSENKSLLMWKVYFELNHDKIEPRLFYYNYDLKYHYYDSLKRFSRLKEEMSKFNIRFYNFDLNRPIKLTRTYDVIILSNILEWKNCLDEEIARDNIIKLLKPNGIAVCSHLGSYNHTEEKTFTKTGELILEEFDAYNEDIGYQYRKVK